MNAKLRRKAEFPLVVLGVIFTDQISKSLATSWLTTGCNPGIAFGIGLSGSLGIWLSFAILCLVFYFVLKGQKTISALGLYLIFGGGVSNLFDRLAFGCVRDFIQVASLTRWPSFNLADAAITAGVSVLVLDLLFWRVKES